MDETSPLGLQWLHRGPAMAAGSGTAWNRSTDLSVGSRRHKLGGKASSQYCPQEATFKGPSIRFTPRDGKLSLSLSSVCAEWQQVWPVPFNTQEELALFHLFISS